MKSIDDKIEDIGFTKIVDNQFGLQYRRCNPKYIEYVVIPNRTPGQETIEMYDMDEFGESYRAQTIFQLKVSELELFIKKAKQHNKQNRYNTCK